ncbi:hypothetical protein JM658_08220 [Joostella atrarenae]|uniref:Uncharacterized protein n=1 Tax=Joostella atrarenae TaxID=679257 RepID=A0ABS9J315_9FLAO|nr:hypothetical protein [Joostella atrarenae]MCF8714811.1 hypothetical protein [Joostella atrarenae]
MKLLLRFFISLSIILISGYSLLFANSNQQQGSISKIDSIENSAPSGVTLIQNAKFFKDCFFSHFEKKEHKFEIVESEVEEELTVYKKNAELNTFVGSTLYSLALLAFFPFPKKHLFHCKKFSNFLSYRLYVIFRVFRI